MYYLAVWPCPQVKHSGSVTKGKRRDWLLGRNRHFYHTTKWIYSWPLKNTGLNCADPLICRLFPWIQLAHHWRVLHPQPNADWKYSVHSCKTYEYRGPTFHICGSTGPTVGLEYVWILLSPGESWNYNPPRIRNDCNLYYFKTYNRKKNLKNNIINKYNQRF